MFNYGCAIQTLPTVASMSKATIHSNAFILGTICGPVLSQMFTEVRGNREKLLCGDGFVLLNSAGAEK